MADAPRWLIRHEGKTYGPADLAALQRLRDSGRLQPHMLVRLSDGGNWIPAEQVEGLSFGKPLAETVPAFVRAKTASRVTVDSTVDDSQALNGASPFGGVALSPDEMAAAPLARTAAPTSAFLERERGRLLSQAPTSVLDIFDWRFEKFLTPVIVRWAWALVVLLLLGSLTFTSATLYWVLLPHAKTAQAAPAGPVAAPQPAPQQIRWVNPLSEVWPEADAFVTRFLLATILTISLCVVVAVVLIKIRVTLELFVVAILACESLRRIERQLPLAD